MDGSLGRLPWCSVTLPSGASTSLLMSAVREMSVPPKLALLLCLTSLILLPLATAAKQTAGCVLTINRAQRSDHHALRPISLSRHSWLRCALVTGTVVYTTHSLELLLLLGCHHSVHVTLRLLPEQVLCLSPAHSTHSMTHVTTRLCRMLSIVITTIAGQSKTTCEV